MLEHQIHVDVIHTNSFRFIGKRMSFLAKKGPFDNTTMLTVDVVNEDQIPPLPEVGSDEKLINEQVVRIVLDDAVDILTTQYAFDFLTELLNQLPQYGVRRYHSEGFILIWNTAVVTVRFEQIHQSSDDRPIGAVERQLLSVLAHYIERTIAPAEGDPTRAIFFDTCRKYHQKSM